MKTAELNAKVFPYILNAIDSEAYEVKTATDTDKLQFLADTFKKEYCYPQNLQRYGSYQETFRQWIMGLPSVFNIDFENYRILEIAREWKSIPQNATEKQEDKMLENWFNLIASKTFILMKKHNVLPH
jgi:hypothetical protein